MSALIWVGVAILGGLGACVRFLLDAVIATRSPLIFPLGTLVVNVSGALALGLLLGASLAGNAYLLAGTATIGSYTTFSTWMLESHRLGEEGERGPLIANILISIAIGIPAVALGRVIGAAL